METDILQCDAQSPDPSIVRRAAAVLREGGLVVFPTETVYGLASDPDPDCIQSIYEAKGRDENKPVAFFIRSTDQVRELGAALPPPAKRLAEAFWPGALTLVLPAEGGDWIGFRYPDHPLPIALLEARGRPLAVTSANRSGEPAAMDGDQARQALQGRVRLLLDGGPVTGGVPSTVIRAGRTGDPEILREGALDRATCLRIAGDTA